MPVKIQLKCPMCGEGIIGLDEAITKICDLCGAEFETESTCSNEHYVCPMCRQKAARRALIEHCLQSKHEQPYPLLLELMKLPEVAMHGPEHHLLLTASLLTAFCNEKGRQKDLPDLLDEANERTLTVPGGACGYWGICGAAIGSGIYMSILNESDPYAEAEWRAAGQCTASCAEAIALAGGPRCCKRDSFLSLKQVTGHSNRVLETHFFFPSDIQCEFYPNNEECKRRDCPFFPSKR